MSKSDIIVMQFGSKLATVKYVFSTTLAFGNDKIGEMLSSVTIQDILFWQHQR